MLIRFRKNLGWPAPSPKFSLPHCLNRRQIRFRIHLRLNPGYHLTGKVPAADHHAPILPKSTGGVKRVFVQPSQGGESILHSHSFSIPTHSPSRMPSLELPPATVAVVI